MTTYEYSLSNDFPDGLNESLLGREIIDATLGQDLIDIGRAGAVVSVSFAGALVSPPALDALVAAHDPAGFRFEANFHEDEYLNHRLVRRTAYARKVGSVYLYKVHETLFTYQDSYLLAEEYTVFQITGAAERVRVWNYTTTISGDTTLVRKEEG